MATTGQRNGVAQVLILLVCLVFVSLIGRLVYINVAMADELRAWSDPRQTSTVVIPGRRGFILDRRYRPLAGSQDHYTVYSDPRFISDHAEAAEQLGPVLKMPIPDVQALLVKPTSPGYVVLKREIDTGQVEQVRRLDIPGVGVQREPGRTYPMGRLAAHVIGFVGKDGCGLDGVEMTLDKYLKATPGKRVVYRDVSRRAIYQKDGSYVAPKDGLHVVLTIDAAIQEKLEELVAERVEHHEAENGLGIVMNPQTGEVLAMTNYPTFNPDEAGRFPTELRRNRILTDPVEPGSIFKPYIMSAALEAGKARPEDTIFCENGLYMIGKRPLHDHHPYGHLTVTQIMAKSSNIGMAKLGERLGNEAMYHALRRFGYGQVTGIDLPGEGEGLLMPLKNWQHYTTHSVPMGHELAVTPIQVLNAFCSIVNGGRLLQPRVVSAVLDEEGQMVEDRSRPVEKGRTLTPEVAEQMVHILCSVVEEGTGTACKLEQWQVLGKTGTAQLPRIGKGVKGYEPGGYLASFIAAAPAPDPQVAVLVMVRFPKKNGYYGSQVALPAVKEVLAFTLDYLKVPPMRFEGKNRNDVQLAAHARH